MKECLREWKFLQLALCLAALFIVLPWASEHWMFQVAVQLFLLNSLLVTISDEGRKSRLRPFLWITWGLSVAASILTWLPLPFDVHALEFFFFGSCSDRLRCGNPPIRVPIETGHGRQHLRRGRGLPARRRDLRRSSKCCCCTGNPRASASRMPIPTQPGVLRSDLLYFSLVTLVTLGYGDIVPVTPLARMVAAFEGVVGQFYVAAVVAMLVGRFIAQAIEEGDSGSPRSKG